LRKIAVFVDVQNVYYTVKQAYGAQFDYSAFWRELSSLGEIILATAYAIDRNDPKQQRIQQILRDIGFTVKLKPYLQRHDGSTKGDWDVGIAIDVLEQSVDVDTVVLVSGDGDFDLLMDKLRERGKHAVVYGVQELSALSLVRAASEFRAIDRKLLLLDKA